MQHSSWSAQFLEVEANAVYENMIAWISGRCREKGKEDGR
jgi:hypothetical protein